MQDRFDFGRRLSYDLTKQPLPYPIPRIAHPTSTAERWANYVLGACKSEKDPRTLGIWARQVAVSYTTLCESCRLIGVQPRHARDFARVLRIVIRPFFKATDLASFLDISDRRTLESILDAAGLLGDASVTRQVSVVSFLDSQRFIAHENAGLGVLREILLVKPSTIELDLPTATTS